MQKSINGATFRKMILNGAKLLDINKQHVDSLNVFPVPDGDTGTNMSLTMLSASKGRFARRARQQRRYTKPNIKRYGHRFVAVGRNYGA